MQSYFGRSPTKQPRKGVQNILIRYSCSAKIKINSAYQHPEADYIRKYSPKYYQGLTLEVTRQGSLLSKVKKIKKLKKFTGLFKDNLPQKLWFVLLANQRKEIEEIPQVISKKVSLRYSQSFWKRLTLQRIKYFLNMRSPFRSRGNDDSRRNDFENILLVKESFVKYLGNMRKLKHLEILIREDNYSQAKWLINKLNGMNNAFFSRLESLSIDLKTRKMKIQELFQNKTIFSHVTDLNFLVKFDPIFCEVLESCKNLRSLSFDFLNVSDQKPEFLRFLAGILSLSQLKSLEFAWPCEAKHFWNHFKPQPSLRYLKFRFDTPHLIKDGVFDLEAKDQDLVTHWEDIKELDGLEFNIAYVNPTDIILVRFFITKVLKKVRKLGSLKCWMMNPVESNDSLTYEPFLVQEVPHLYESLEKFEYALYNYPIVDSKNFDLKILKPFKGLNVVKLEGNVVFYKNIEEMVSLLEGSQRRYPMLEVRVASKCEPYWVRDTLEKIQKIKIDERDLRIVIELAFHRGPFRKLFEKLCKNIQATKRINGLTISLSFVEYEDSGWFSEEEVKGVLKKYAEIRNLMVEFGNAEKTLGYITLDGEKEQLWVDTF